MNVKVVKDLWDVEAKCPCLKCIVKLCVLQEFNPTQLRELFEQGPGANSSTSITRIIEDKKHTGKLVIEITLNRKFACLVNFDPVFAHWTNLSPKKLGVDPIIEFDQSAASWLGLA